VADPSGYIFTWLVGYSSLLGPVGGIMIADYYFVRKQQLLTDDLYANKGIYSFKNGFNNAAIIALLIGILPNVPGFLVTIKVLPADRVWPWVANLYNYAWFVGFFMSGNSYLLLMRYYKTIPGNYKEKTYVAAN
jgi:nucleobase:cation symporter-1, NCS1 family